MARAPITRANPYTPARGALAGRTFSTERAYRNALAQRKGFASLSGQQAAPKAIKSRRGLLSLKPREAEDRARALDAISKMRREGLSLSEAAKESGTTPNTVRKWGGDAIEKQGSRFSAKPTDRLARSMWMLRDHPAERIIVTITDSRTASKIGRYQNAVRFYLYGDSTHEPGDFSRVERFTGQYITVQREHIPFLTDRVAVDFLAARGLLSFESIYAHAA